MQELMLIVHVVSVICLIILVLLQQGKGADMGAAFGSGASNTMFGSTGSVSFFTKLTAIVALIFFISSISLGALVAQRVKQTTALGNFVPVPSDLEKDQR